MVDVANPGFVRPPLVYSVAVGVGLLFERLWPTGFSTNAVSQFTGLLGLLSAVLLFLFTQLEFRRAKTPLPGTSPVEALVKSGPLRFTRSAGLEYNAKIQTGLVGMFHCRALL